MNSSISSDRRPVGTSTGYCNSCHVTHKDFVQSKDSWSRKRTSRRKHQRHGTLRIYHTWRSSKDHGLKEQKKLKGLITSEIVGLILTSRTLQLWKVISVGAWKGPSQICLARAQHNFGQKIFRKFVSEKMCVGKKLVTFSKATYVNLWLRRFIALITTRGTTIRGRPLEKGQLSL